MSRPHNLLLALFIGLLIFGVFLCRRQSELLKRQGELERAVERNPFIEPVGNSNQTTTPEKP